MTAPLRRNGILVTTIQRGCEEKHRHPDEFVARAMALTQQNLSGYRMFIYQCRVCRGWHLTKKEQRDERRAADYHKPTPR